MRPFQLLVIYTLSSITVFAQQKDADPELRFHRELGSGSGDNFGTMAQDKYGFMWFGRYARGLQRYDGADLKTYLHDPADSNSIANNWVESLAIDNDNMIWIGTWGKGLDRFDMQANRFVHYRHRDNDPQSISNDTITALLADRSGNVWVGSYGGLDLLDKKTGKFTHYRHDKNDARSLSYNEVRIIYEDHAGEIWVGCGRPWMNTLQKKEDGGLNRLDKKTGKFIRYLHNPNDSSTISNNKVRALFEDSRGSFWVGTMEDGLQTLDRATGKFTHYYYDPKHPEKLSRPRQLTDASLGGISLDHISFITEDSRGNILIGAHFQGLNYYNRQTQKVTHYGMLFNEKGEAIAADTATGLGANPLWKTFTSADGVIWLGAGNDVYTIRPAKSLLPHYAVTNDKADVNTLYCDPGGNILWLGTDHGLFRKDLRTNEEKVYKHDRKNVNSLPSDTVSSIKADGKGNFWIGTSNGLSYFEPGPAHFFNYYHDETQQNSLSSNSINYIFISRDKEVWIGTNNTGLDKYDPVRKIFTNYRYDLHKNTMSSDQVTGITEDNNGTIWIATSYGLNAFNKVSGDFAHYFVNSQVSCVFTDTAGIVWSAIPNTIYYFDSAHHVFRPFEDKNRQEEIPNVINIVSDKSGNLWLTTPNTILRLHRKTGDIKVFDAENGVRQNVFSFADNFVNERGTLYLGDQDGYYVVDPATGKDSNAFFHINLTNFKIADIEVTTVNNGTAISTIWDAQEIHLPHHQNAFSFEFVAIDYTSPGDFKYSYRTVNYDNTWRYIGKEHKIYFFNMPPGRYALHLKATRKDGEWREKIIQIIIAPPWWRTWWAYVSYGVLFLLLAFGANRAIRNKILEKEREKNREKELVQAKEIEKAYLELKQTQAQLIQSEKMASLGQLTAGIAHEIQNPLNFVNNFSEVTTELVNELTEEVNKDNKAEIKQLASEIQQNLQKINHHGKRADAIVKGMLQHSRSDKGTRGLTDINALADEYLKLAYHGLRAKDKSFNVTLRTAFDNSIGLINIVPQDIGRVLLNLFNNAFYAVKNYQPPAGTNYMPTVSLTTKRMGDAIMLEVKDNGSGIPQNIADKIFQPFYTTKPTGQGTGLGLSLAYDIIKAHGGDIKVATGENEGATFTVLLPG